jgi:tripeptide aminopeptidase
MINKERVLAEFLEMVQIKCSTLQEREIADLLKVKLSALNMTVSEDDVGTKLGGTAGNIYGYWQGSQSNVPRILLSAHMDCVEPCAGIQPVRENGVIRSAGNTILGSDDKAGVVPILEALRVIQENKLPHGDIQVVFTVAEEGGVNGSKNMDPSLLKADMGFVLDSSGAPGKIITMAPGQYKIKVTVQGKTAHAGIAPEEGINAIVLAGKALAEIKEGRIDEETTANVGIIKGGQATNIVPDRVEVTCEARSRDAAKLEAQTKLMCDTFERVVTENGGKVEIQVSKAYDPYVHHESAPVLQIAKAAAESIGLTPELEGTGGGSDANFFNNYGVPSAVLGVGMSKVHTTEEYIKEEDLYKTAEYVVAIITKVASMAK